MERRRLGKSGLTVPAIGLGTWRTFDTLEDRRPIVDEAVESGIDLFDSSPMYGRAETTLAAALEGRRDRVQVATKVWTPEPDAGRGQAELQLRLFGWVDLLQVHNLVSWQAQLSLIEELKSDGRVRAAGATHYQASAFPELAEVMRTGRLDAIQIPYSPLATDAAERILPLAEEMGLGVLVMSPLQGGILDARPSPAELRELGVETWPQAVLRWIVSDPRVSCVLTATQTPGHAAENAAAGSPPWLDDDQRRLVAEIARR